MTKRCLIIRADASVRMGSGHLMRCMALGQAWRERSGTVVFITRCESRALLECLLAEAFEVLLLDGPHSAIGDQGATLRSLRTHPDACVVLDGYHFDSDFQSEVMASGHRLLVVDDIAHLPRYSANILLNQNIGAEWLIYRCDPGTVLLMGPQYALLRSDFLQWRSWRRETPVLSRRILVTLGGSDPENLTLKVMRALACLGHSDLEARIVVGHANPHLASLRRAISSSGDTLQIATGVRNMPELMAWADLAVSAGGSTCWELAFMGLPNVILVLAKNQQGIGEGLAAEGVAVNLGWHDTLSEEQIAAALGDLMGGRARREAMSARGRQVVDGQGAARVVAALLKEGE